MVDPQTVYGTFGPNRDRTLPIYFGRGKALETIPAFGSGMVRLENKLHDYSPAEVGWNWNSPPLEVLNESAESAVRAAGGWLRHVSAYGAYSQYADVPAEKSRLLHAHTETLVTVFDARLTIDAEILWITYEDVFSFASIHASFRADHIREEKRSDYESRLNRVYDKLSEHKSRASIAIRRGVVQIRAAGDAWVAMRRFDPKGDLAKEGASSKPQAVSVFFSYSHEDDIFRKRLDAHLGSLKREGVVENWYDRKISGGREWDEEIDARLESCDIVLLLVSADFINSDYCWNKEVRRAMERHEAKKARVIPIILRHCDWHRTPFGKLQALPLDAKPVTKWDDDDEALTDIARGIRRVVNELIGSAK